MGKLKYSWMTAVPGIVMAVTTLYAGYLNITTNYLPGGKYLLAVLSIIVMILVVIILFAAAKRCYDLLQMKNPVIDKYGDLVLETVEE
jgi:carbon starvation protein